MKVILNSDLKNLGEEGDILDLSPGYVRNYLLPRGLVSLENKANLALLEGKKQAIEQRRAIKREAAKSLQQRLTELSLDFHMPAGDSGKLFGSVTAQMIAEELSKHDISIEKKFIDIPGHTIKVVGKYPVTVRLYNSEEARLHVQVYNKNKAKNSANEDSEASGKEAENGGEGKHAEGTGDTHKE